MELENFKIFYNEILALKDECLASHETWATSMLKFIKEHGDSFWELKPLDCSPDLQEKTL